MKKASGAEIQGCVGRAEMQQMVRSDGGDPLVASVGVASSSPLLSVAVGVSRVILILYPLYITCFLLPLF